LNIEQNRAEQSRVEQGKVELRVANYKLRNISLELSRRKLNEWSKVESSEQAIDYVREKSKE
jgi:hypothetical protein